jgi:hypothetical protein
MTAIHDDRTAANKSYFDTIAQEYDTRFAAENNERAEQLGSSMSESMLFKVT